MSLHRVLARSVWHCEYVGSLFPNHHILQRKKKVHLLIETYPESLTIKDNDGQLPLHAAVGDDWCELFGEDVDPVCMKLAAFVFRAFPAALQFRDSEGKTPLENALSNGNFTART
jgi:ankyrin repeat protein